jgi:hypothetical protein
VFKSKIGINDNLDMNMKLGEALKNKIETELEKKSVKKVDFMVLCEVYSQAKKQI